MRRLCDSPESTAYLFVPKVGRLDSLMCLTIRQCLDVFEFIDLAYSFDKQIYSAMFFASSSRWHISILDLDKLSKYRKVKWPIIWITCFWILDFRHKSLFSGKPTFRTTYLKKKKRIFTRIYAWKKISLHLFRLHCFALLGTRRIQFLRVRN